MNEQSTNILVRERYKLKLLYQDNIKLLYQSRLNTAMEEMTPSEDIEEEYTNLKITIKRAADEVLGEESGAKRENEPFWLTDDGKAITEKQNKYRTWLSDHSNENWDEYKHKNRVRKN